jgi:hypothetical protein
MRVGVRLHRCFSRTGVPSLIFGPSNLRTTCFLSVVGDWTFSRQESIQWIFNTKGHTNRCSTESFISITPTHNSLDLNTLRSKKSKWPEETVRSSMTIASSVLLKLWGCYFRIILIFPLLLRACNSWEEARVASGWGIF